MPINEPEELEQADLKTLVPVCVFVCGTCFSVAPASSPSAKGSGEPAKELSPAGEMAAGAKIPPYRSADRRTGTDQQKTKQNGKCILASCFKLQIHQIKSFIHRVREVNRRLTLNHLWN